MKNIAIDNVMVTLDDCGLKVITRNGESFTCPLTGDDRERVKGVTFEKECDLTLQLNDEDFEFMMLRYGAREINEECGLT